jgi:hypothetical protein
MEAVAIAAHIRRLNTIWYCYWVCFRFIFEDYVVRMYELQLGQTKNENDLSDKNDIVAG